MIIVDLGNGNIVKCHIDQLTQCLAPQPVDSESKETPSTEDHFHYPELPALLSQKPVDDIAPTQHYPQRVRRLPISTIETLLFVGDEMY